MAQHTISTEDVRRIGRVVAEFEGRPINSLPRLERVVRIEGGGGGGSGGGGDDPTTGLCGPCGSTFDVGSVDIPEVGRASTFSAWQNPIPSGEPSLIVGEINEDFEYHPIEGVDPTFECADDPPPEE